MLFIISMQLGSDAQDEGRCWKMAHQAFWGGFVCWVRRHRTAEPPTLPLKVMPVAILYQVASGHILPNFFPVAAVASFPMFNLGLTVGC